MNTRTRRGAEGCGNVVLMNDMVPTTRSAERSGIMLVHPPCDGEVVEYTASKRVSQWFQCLNNTLGVGTTYDSSDLGLLSNSLNRHKHQSTILVTRLCARPCQELR